MSQVNVTYCNPKSPPHVGEKLTVDYLSQHLSSGEILVSGRHVSPEQIFHAGDIDHRADIFSLGAIWYDMLFQPGPDDLIERDRIDTAPLSEDGRDILKMMLAERRSERPDSMRDVQDWLATLG